MAGGFPPPPRSAHPRQLVNAGPSGRRRPPPLAVQPPSDPRGPQLPRRCCRHIRSGIRTPCGIAPRRAPLSCWGARCHSSGSRRVKARWHRPRARLEYHTTSPVACGLPCGDAAVDLGSSGDWGTLRRWGKGAAAGGDQHRLGRPAAVGSGRGSGERQRQWGAAAQFGCGRNAANELSRADHRGGKCDAGSSGDGNGWGPRVGGEGRHPHCGEGGVMGGVGAGGSRRTPCLWMTRPADGGRTGSATETKGSSGGWRR